MLLLVWIQTMQVNSGILPFFKLKSLHCVSHVCMNATSFNAIINIDVCTDVRKIRCCHYSAKVLAR